MMHSSFHTEQRTTDPTLLTAASDSSGTVSWATLGSAAADSTEVDSRLPHRGLAGYDAESDSQHCAFPHRPHSTVRVQGNDVSSLHHTC